MHKSMKWDNPEDLFHNTKRLDEFLQMKEKELEEMTMKLPSERI